MRAILKCSILFVFVFVMFTDCKKKKQQADTEPQPTSHQPFNPSKLNGFLYKELTYFLKNDTLKVSSLYVSSALFDTLIHRDSILISGTPVDAGDIFFNEQLLNKIIANEGRYYSLFTGNGLLGLAPNKWKIQGSNQFLGFNYTDNVPEPKFSGLNDLIDTVWVMHENVLKIKGLSGADKIEVHIEAESSPMEISGPKEISTTDKELKFAGWETTPLMTSMDSLVNIVVKATRNNYRTIGGHVLNFQTCIIFKVTVPAKYT